MANKQGDFLWYELIAPDAGAAADYYCHVLGWTVRSAGGAVPGYRIFGIGGQDVGGMMDMPAGAKAEGMRPMWLGYVAVNDVDAAAAKIVAGGGVQHMPPTDIPDVGRLAMLVDPQGAPFYVMRGAHEGRSNSFDPAQAGHCNWNELVTTDQISAFTFYGDQFGWRKGDVMPMGPMGDYSFIDHGGATIGAMMNGQNGDRPMWNFYFGVEDIDAAVERLIQRGGKLTFGPSEVPGGLFALNATDPQGVRFGLVGPRVEH